MVTVTVTVTVKADFTWQMHVPFAMNTYVECTRVFDWFHGCDKDLGRDDENSQVPVGRLSQVDVLNGLASACLGRQWMLVQSVLCAFCF